MSYTIIYEKTFLKTSKNTFLPMVICGSNNCYEWNNKRRVRDWACFFSDKYLYTETELLQNIEDWRQSDKKQYDNCEYDFNDIPFGGCRLSTNNYTTFEDLKKFIKHGVNRAIDFNKFIEMGYMVNFRSYNCEFNMYPKTEQELFDCIEKAIAFEETVYVNLSLSEDNVKRLRKQIYPKGSSKTKIVQELVDHYFVLKTENKKYVVKKLKYGMRVNSHYWYAKKFKTKKSAENYGKKFEGVTIVKIEENAYISKRVPK